MPCRMMIRVESQPHQPRQSVVARTRTLDSPLNSHCSLRWIRAPFAATSWILVVHYLVMLIIARSMIQKDSEGSLSLMCTFQGRTLRFVPLASTIFLFFCAVFPQLAYFSIPFSRFLGHTQVLCNRGRFLIADLSSRNGTLIQRHFHRRCQSTPINEQLRPSALFPIDAIPGYAVNVTSSFSLSNFVLSPITVHTGSDALSVCFFFFVFGFWGCCLSDCICHPPPFVPHSLGLAAPHWLTFLLS